LYNATESHDTFFIYSRNTKSVGLYEEPLLNGIASPSRAWFIFVKAAAIKVLAETE
jgi:hypothetical protein